MCQAITSWTIVYQPQQVLPGCTCIWCKPKSDRTDISPLHTREALGQWLNERPSTFVLIYPVPGLKIFIGDQNSYIPRDNNDGYKPQVGHPPLPWLPWGALIYVKRQTAILISATVPAAVVSAVTPKVRVRPVTDPKILRQGSEFAELAYQSLPLAEPGSREAKQLAKLLMETTAHPRGLTKATALRQATEGRDLIKASLSPNGKGTIAEILVQKRLKAWHRGEDVGIVNPPKVCTPHLGHHVSPNCSSGKDGILGIPLRNQNGLGDKSNVGQALKKPPTPVSSPVQNGTSIGDKNSVRIAPEKAPGTGLPQERFFKTFGQVKIGGRKYVARQWRDHAKKGKSGMFQTDARFVRPDGGPRADTLGTRNAAHLEELGAKARGFPNIEKDSVEFQNEVLRPFQEDGLTPPERAQKQQYHADIAKTYQPKAVAARAVAAAGTGGLLAAGMSAATQYMDTGKVDGKQMAKDAGVGAVYSAAGVVLDKAVHSAALAKGLGQEAAKTVAGRAVGMSFFGLAVGMDIYQAVKEVKAGGDVDTAVGRCVANTAVNVAATACLFIPIPVVNVLASLIVGFFGRWFTRKI